MIEDLTELWKKYLSWRKSYEGRTFKRPMDTTFNDFMFWLISVEGIK
jgi:hypothetical protein